ncbi:hypothetical protein CRYUN_Cryun37aG0075100 [Craigia yunnanensis]
MKVSQQFAECISLPNRTTVQVRAASILAKATLVTIEPHTEDDWEVLELNSEYAEAAILKQVRIVHEGMRFPLWLHGRTIITFFVVSTFPKKAVVQLVPGTEVAVAPKRRKKNLNNMESSTAEYHGAKALLRLQDSDRRLFHKSNVKGVELGVALTSVAFIHQETAKIFSLESLQLVVIVPRLSSKESVNNLENDASRMKGSLTSKEVNSGISTDNKEFRQVIVRLLISDSVTKGHIMITRSLRLYLRAGLHSWVFLKGYNVALKKEIPVLSLSPCHFKMVANDKALENGLEVLDDHKTPRTKNSLPITEAEDSSHQDTKKGLECLLHAWFLAQLDAIASIGRTEVNTLVLGNENLLHFEVNRYDSGTYRLISSNGFSEKRDKTKDLSVEISYILTISEETLHSGKVNAYELALDDRNKRNDVQGGVELFGKLNLGMMVLLAPASGIWFSTYNLPLPEHVLIYGPAVSYYNLLLLLEFVLVKVLERHYWQEYCILEFGYYQEASKCDGYDAYDLEILVERAVHAAISRFLPSGSGSEKHMKPLLVRDDFSHKMHEFLPVAMRDITKSAPEVGRSGWDDIGGLNDIQDAIKETIELPSSFPNIFAQAPLRLRSNVLLYGPPGCGKTHIVGAAAAASSLRFILVKGPELLNKCIGASEQAVREYN